MSVFRSVVTVAPLRSACRARSWGGRCNQLAGFRPRFAKPRCHSRVSRPPVTWRAPAAPTGRPAPGPPRAGAAGGPQGYSRLYGTSSS
eukprot:4944324-Prymnesium_polylepis.1